MNQTLLDTGALLQRVYAGLSLYMTYYVYGFCMILIKGIQCCNVIKFFKHSDFDLCLLAFKMDLWNWISEAYKYDFDRYTIFRFSHL